MCIKEHIYILKGYNSVMKDLDKELELIPPIDLPKPPMVRETPPGWSSYPTFDGETWYERAMAFQRWSGHPPIPLDYVYDENWNILTVEEYNEKHKDDIPEFIEPEVSEEDRVAGIDVEWVKNPEVKEEE